MFSIALENTIQYNYFTEKIIDCMFTYTVPLYRGCPNIGQYFDRRGMIFVDSGPDIIEKANSLTERDYYDRLPYIKANKDLTERYRGLFKAYEMMGRYFTFMHKFYNLET